MYVAYIDGERDGWCIAFLGRHYCGPFHSEDECRAFAAGLNEEARSQPPSKREDRAAPNNRKEVMT